MAGALPALPALPELLMAASQGPSLDSPSQPLINTQNDSLDYLSPLVDILNEMGLKHHQISREMQVKTAMSYHPPPVRIAIIKKTKDNESGQGLGKKGTLMRCWQECQLVQLLGKQYGGFSENQKQNYHMVQQLPLWVCIQGK